MSAGDERRKQALLAGPVRRVQRRLNQELWARALVMPAWISAAAVAAYRLLLRSQVWLAVLAGVAGALIAAAVRLRRTRVSTQTAAALTDQAAGAGGLLLTRLEVPVGAWELSLNEQVRRIRPPRVQLAAPVLRTLGAIAFLAVALWIPLPPPRAQVPNAAAQGEVSQLSAKAGVLQKEQPLGSAVEQELARLQREAAQGQFSPADWAAADAVKATLDAQAQAAAEKLARAQEAASALESSLERSAGGEAEQREREELEQALIDLDARSGQQGGQSPDGAAGKSAGDAPTEGAQAGTEAQGAGKDGAKSGPRDGAATGKQGEAAGRSQASAQAGGTGTQGKDGQGEHGKSADPSRSAGAKAAAAGKRDVQQLRQALEARQRALSQAFGDRAKPGEGRGQGKTASSAGPGKPGREGKEDGKGMPGVGEGGHSRPLRFGEAAPLAPEKLGFEPLPPGRGGNAEELWGLKAADPKPGADLARGGGTGEVAAGDQAPGNAAGALLPRNRALVRRYFDSAATPAATPR